VSLGHHPEAIPSKLLSVLIPALEDPEPRSVVISSSLSSYQTRHLFISFQSACPRSLGANQLLRRRREGHAIALSRSDRRALLKPAGDPALVRCYVKEQGITTLAVVQMRARLLLWRWASGPGTARGYWMMRLIWFVGTIQRLCRCCWMFYRMILCSLTDRCWPRRIPPRCGNARQATHAYSMFVILVLSTLRALAN